MEQAGPHAERPGLMRQHWAHMKCRLWELKAGSTAQGLVVVAWTHPATFGTGLTEHAYMPPTSYAETRRTTPHKPYCNMYCCIVERARCWWNTENLLAPVHVGASSLCSSAHMQQGSFTSMLG